MNCEIWSCRSLLSVLIPWCKRFLWLSVCQWRRVLAGFPVVVSGEATADSSGRLRSGSERLCGSGVCSTSASVCEWTHHTLHSVSVITVTDGRVSVWQEYIPTVFTPKRSSDALHQDLMLQCERMDLPFLSYLPTEVRQQTLRSNSSNPRLELLKTMSFSESIWVQQKTTEAFNIFKKAL